jgi:hypothetical protein
MGPLAGPFAGPFIGIDVGEDFLDLAIVGARPRTLVFKRVALGGLNEHACDTLANRINGAAPGLDAAALALVDSPRWPRDLDWSRGTHERDPAPRGRELDAILRRVFRTLMTAPDGKARMPGLAMFPTPRYDYFARCARDPRCKPHLSAIASELFNELLTDDGDAREPAPGGGAIFTRFMLAGFAAYRALERLGVPAFESYPDLQLRLSSPSQDIPPEDLPPKRRRAEALAARRRIVAALAAGLELRDAPVAANLDQADAAVLALAAASSAQSGALWVVSNPCEGRFMLALDSRQAQSLGCART